MRDAFIDELLNIAKSDSRVVLITADLGFGVLDKFRNEIPKQFINVGVAEQNMIGIATGLALEGYVTYCYSIGNFSTLRCLEQIRNDALYHDANVKVVAVGGGFSYGPLGMSHHATEDIAIMRALPGMKVIVPSTLEEAAGVVYVRLDKSAANLNISRDELDLFEWQTVREGKEVCLVTTGGILQESILAAVELESKGIDVKLISATNLTPNDPALVINSISNCKLVVSIEEHFINGGLGGLLSEVIAEHCLGTKLIRLGLKPEHVSTIGSQNYLRKLSGISAEGIVSATLGALTKE